MATYDADSSELLTTWEDGDHWNNMIVTGDTFGVTNGGTVTVDASRALNQILIGCNGDGSDPGVGNRWGKIILNPGITLTFDGAADYRNSGIKCYPSATGAETLDCQLDINGAEGSPVILTNSIADVNTNNQWSIYMYYGIIGNITHFTMKYAAYNSARAFVVPASASTSNAVKHIIKGPITYYAGTMPSAYSVNVVSFISHASIDLEVGKVKFDCSSILGSLYAYSAGNLGYGVNCEIKTGGTELLSLNSGKTVFLTGFDRWNAASLGAPAYAAPFRVGISALNRNRLSYAM